MSAISDKILSKIKNEHLKPLPGWRFRLRDGGQWAGLMLFIFLIIMSLGLLWYFWTDNPWIHGGRFGFGLFFGRMPLILIGLIILGGFLASLDFRNIGRGYRYSFIKIGLVLLFLAVTAGWLFNYFGISRRADKFFSSVPLYQNREAYMKEVWQKPDDGLLAGKIINIRSDNSYSLRDLDGKIWIIDTAQAVWRHNLRPEIDLKIKLIGLAAGDNFTVEEVRPWQGSGGCGRAQGAGFCGMIKQ